VEAVVPVDFEQEDPRSRRFPARRRIRSIWKSALRGRTRLGRRRRSPRNVGPARPPTTTDGESFDQIPLSRSGRLRSTRCVQNERCGATRSPRERGQRELSGATPRYQLKRTGASACPGFPRPAP
jgi:hypothetical protein